MPSIYQLKPAFQKVLRPVVGRLASAGVTPNQITVLTLVLSLITGTLLALFPHHATLFFLVPLAMLLRMALNAVDGMLAREHSMITPLGAILNEVGDVVSDAALCLPFALLPGLDPKLIVGVVVLSLVSEVTGLAALQAGSERRYDGPMGKSDRAFVFGALALWAAFGGSLALWGNVLLVLMMGLLIWTCINRARSAIGGASNG